MGDLPGASGAPRAGAKTHKKHTFCREAAKLGYCHQASALVARPRAVRLPRGAALASCRRRVSGMAAEADKLEWMWGDERDCFLLAVEGRSKAHTWQTSKERPIGISKYTNLDFGAPGS